MAGGTVCRNVALLDLIEFMLLLRLIDSVPCAKQLSSQSNFLFLEVYQRAIMAQQFSLYP